MVAFVVFAKVPVEGAVKTRIAHSTDVSTALSVYRELLRETASHVERSVYHVAFTGNDTPGELEAVFKGAASFFRQTGSSLGDRMRNACLQMITKGAEAAVIFGCDIPSLSHELLAAAEYALRDNDLVIGPAEDGGYYLIGCKPSALVVFDATGWSMPTLYEETMTIIDDYHLQYETISTLYDVDTVEDYFRWKHHKEEGLRSD